jgi:hypothetical protein
VGIPERCAGVAYLHIGAPQAIEHLPDLGARRRRDKELGGQAADALELYKSSVKLGVERGKESGGIKGSHGMRPSFFG